MAESKKIYVSEEGLEELRKEYDYLVHVAREEVKKELKEARSLGDLSDNADYDAAREKQSQIEKKIIELEDKLNNYEIYDSSKGPKKVVHMGSTVRIRFLDTKEEVEYKICGSTEADPLNGMLSNETPLGQALLDCKVGQTIEVNAKTPYKAKIIDVKN